MHTRENIFFKLVTNGFIGSRNYGGSVVVHCLFEEERHCMLLIGKMFSVSSFIRSHTRTHILKYNKVAHY